jgi:hypothetical protein
MDYVANLAFSCTGCGGNEKMKTGAVNGALEFGVTTTDRE